MDNGPITVRAAGSQHRHAKYVVGNFPLGAPAILKEASSKWKLHKDKPEAIPPRRRQQVPQQDGTPWLLEDAASNVTHKGHLEGGIATSNYFLLVKEHGAFTALPLAAWYNFRPPPRRVAMSLEEAEAEMEKKHNSHFSGTSRLSKAIAANEAQGAKEAGPDEGGAVGADSDEEEKRAVRARAANADQSSTAEGRNQSATADVNVIKGDKGAEDWEYEENAADDDEDMGEQDDPHQGDASPPPRQSPAASQEDEEAEEGNSLSKHGRELQRLLKTTGLSESDDDPSNEDVKEDTSLLTDDDDDDDMEDLDALAKGLDKGTPAASPKPASAAETGRKRSPTPTSGATPALGSKRKNEGGQPAAKRKRSATPPTSQAQLPSIKSEDTAAPAIKKEPTIKKEPIPSPAIKTDPTAPKASGLVTSEEIKALITKSGGSMGATAVSKYFKGRLNTKEEKDQFKRAVRTATNFDTTTKVLSIIK